MNESINIPPTEIPAALHHSHRYQQMDLGDTVILYAGEGPAGQLAVGEIYNIDDFPCVEESECEAVEIFAVAVADKIVRSYNSHDALVATLKKIANWEFDIMGDCVAEAKALAIAALNKAEVTGESDLRSMGR